MAVEMRMCHGFQRPSWYSQYPDVGKEGKGGKGGHPRLVMYRDLPAEYNAS